MLTTVYKLTLKNCPRCQALVECEENLIGSVVTRVDFDTLERSSELYSVLEYLSDIHGISSLSFPFYIFELTDNSIMDYQFINGALSPEDLANKLEELNLAKHQNLPNLPS